jgi:hypothetical protein
MPVVVAAALETSRRGLVAPAAAETDESVVALALRGLRPRAAVAVAVAEVEVEVEVEALGS